MSPRSMRHGLFRMAGIAPARSCQTSFHRHFLVGSLVSSFVGRTVSLGGSRQSGRQSFRPSIEKAVIGTNPSAQPRIAAGDPGFVLLTVLVVTMLASMIAMSVLFSMRTEETASAASRSTEQAWEAAMSGVYRALGHARDSEPGALEWMDSPGHFEAQFVFDDGADRWFFSVYTYGPLGIDPIRFGISDENAKLHLQRADAAALEKLPGFTPGLAQELLDYLDTDAEERLEGAEQSSYDLLPVPYAIRNAPAALIEELLLVRNFHSGLLYGEDANLNFRLDANEADGEERFPPDDGDDELNGGLIRYLTAVSYVLNLTSANEPRINLNDPATDLAALPLPEGTIAYLEARRRANQPLQHPADLLDAEGTFADEQGQQITLRSGIGREELPELLDACTTTNAARLIGLINLNTAPAPVLATLPGIDDALAETIVSVRLGVSPAQRQTPAWLFTEGVIEAELFRQVAPFLCARSFQFRFHVVGYSVPSGRFRVLEAVVDTAPNPPAILYLRELTRYGLPFRIAPDETGEAVFLGGLGDG